MSNVGDRVALHDVEQVARRAFRGALVALVVPALAGCARFGGSAETWSARTQDRLHDLVHDAHPYPAVAWPSAVDSPYERAMASIALDAADNGSTADVDPTGVAYEDAWDDAAGGFAQEAIPSVDVSAVVWRALTHDGREAYRGPGNEKRLVGLAAEALHGGGRPDTWESLAAARLLASIAEHGTQESARSGASAALDSADGEWACDATGPRDLAEVAARAELTELLGDSCESYALSRTEVDRRLTAALAEEASGGRVDPGALETIAAASVLADAGLADPALVDDGVDAMLELAGNDAFEPDPRYALELADLAARSGRRVFFGTRMLQMLRSSVWADGAMPDDARPDAQSLLAVADTFALLPGGPDRRDLAGRVEWDSPSWLPHDRLVVTIAVAPERISVDDLHPLVGVATDFASAPLMLRATRAIGSCPDSVRTYAGHHLDLLRGGDLSLLLRDATAPQLRDLTALHAVAGLCDAIGGDFARSLRTAIGEHIDGLEATDGLYGIHRAEPDLEVTATVIEAQCLLDGDASVPSESLRTLAATRENTDGGSDAVTGGVSLGATLAAAQSLAYADGGCDALSAA